MEENDLKVKDIVFFARILPDLGIYEVCELKIRAVHDTWFSAVEKRTKRSYLYNYSEFGKTIFKDRDKALSLVLDAELNNKKASFIEKDTDIYT